MIKKDLEILNNYFDKLNSDNNVKEITSPKIK